VAPATGTVTSQQSAVTGVATSLGVTHPPDLADGGVVLLITSCVRNGGGAITWTPPSGFEQRGTDQALSSGTLELTVWAKRVTDAGTEGAWTVSVSHGGTAPTAANLAAIAVHVTGAEDPADIVAVFAIENVAVASFVAPTVTVDDNDSLIYAGAVAQRAGTWTPPVSGYTELVDIVTTGNATANESALCLADSDALEAAGTEAPGTFTYSQTRQGISYTIAVGPGAAGGTTHEESYAGTTTPTAGLVRQTTKPTAGALTPTSTLARAVEQARAGNVAPAGIVSQQVAASLSGTSTPTGLLATALLKMLALSGSTAPAGTLGHQVGKPAASTVDAASTLIREIEQFLAGLSVPSGTTSRQVDVTLAGATTPTAQLLTASVRVLALAGSIASLGTLAKTTARTLAGSTAPAGSTTRVVATSLAGTVTPAGVQRRLVEQTLVAAVLAGGVLANAVLGAFTGAELPLDSDTVGPGLRAVTVGPRLSASTKVTRP
jgi:hypothetical protein